MEIHFPEAHRTMIDELVASGRFPTVEAALLEGVRLLAENEQLRRQVQTGVDQADHGDLHDHDSIFAQLRAMARQADTGLHG